MNRVGRFFTQFLTYALFAACVGYLSASPGYQYGSQQNTTVKLSLSHAAKRVKPCVQLTPQEIAALAPNMRQAERCERARLPLSVELVIDGEIVIDLQAQPSGLWSDGPASVYERFEIRPGIHSVTARLRDTAREQGWDYSHTEDVNFVAGRYIAVTFQSESGGFRFR